MIEAASYGAYTAVPLALNIAGNLIAFLALLALLNGILGYLGGLAGVPELSFEVKVLGVMNISLALFIMNIVIFLAGIFLIKSQQRF